jgi:hypothetical protein
MGSVHFRGQQLDIPEVVTREQLRQLLGLKRHEIPVQVDKQGNFHPLTGTEHRIEEEATIDKVNRLELG